MVGRGLFLLALVVLTIALLVSAARSPDTDKALAEPEIEADVELTEPEPAGPQRAPSNVPMTRLAVGEKPPQFVLFSFDGVGLTPNWDMFLDAAAETDARFTALMTGLYFLTDDNADEYQGPGREPGEAAIAFGGDEAAVLEQIDYLNRTWYAGHEMGTHYVGHFCEGTRYPGNAWTAADWEHELDEFFDLMANWREHNGITAGDDLAFGPEVVKGGRTQCLDGSMPRLFPALRAHDMTWDSSMTARKTGLYWPTEINGIWEFPVPTVYSPPLDRKQMALDYNFWFTVNGAKERPADRERIEEVVLDTYLYMFDEAYNGNRAPLVIANHFNDWNDNAFNPATAEFMREVCGKPDVYCATYQDVIAWMELQDPAVLRPWRTMVPVAVG